MRNPAKVLNVVFAPFGFWQDVINFSRPIKFYAGKRAATFLCFPQARKFDMSGPLMSAQLGHPRPKETPCIIGPILLADVFSICIAPRSLLRPHCLSIGGSLSRHVLAL
jgi:hypothetical protein